MAKEGEENLSPVDQACKPYSDLFEVRELDHLEGMGGVKGIAEALNTDLENGLANDEAVAVNREKFGPNQLPDPPSKSFLKLFLEALSDLMLIILMISAVISLILVLVFNDPDDKLGWVDSVSILVAVLIVSLVQALTNWNQQKAFTSINRQKNDNAVVVIRAGERIKVPATEVVVGDVMYLDAGNKVTGDGLYISGRAIKLDESAITGETLPISCSEEKPFMMAGATVESGDAFQLVCSVGAHTTTGVVFAKMNETAGEEEETPLQEKLNSLAKYITYLGLVGALLTFIVLLVDWIMDIAGKKWHNTFANVLVKHFIVAVTIFVCAVPEGLPLAVTISLSYSMSRMMEDNNFVRHLNACETMGGASNICSDKTGTLTTNRMTVTRLYFGTKDYGQDDAVPFPDDIKQYFGVGLAVNTKGKVTKDDNGILIYDGKSTECALCLYAEGLGFDYEELRKEYPSINLYDFNSDRKRMTTIIKSPVNPDQTLVASKGAPDVVINMCSHYIDDDGSRKPITDEYKATLTDQLTEYSKQMLRNMLVCYRIDGASDTPEDAEKDLTVIACAAISDPLRPEVPDAVAQCKQAGVIVRMVTGDNIETAKAIAKECGILSDDGICMTGNEFRKTPKLELLDILPKLQVLARSTPMDKYRLVRTLREAGEVVAATGDGTNDALALRTADVGLSMGLCGTEIAKEASDICILDDNFKSIMMSIMWGRCTFDNVRRFLQFQLTVNVAALVISFLGSVVFKESPLKPIQLLWVNLIMDSFGALALATEKPRPYLLTRPPYGRKVPLLSPVLMTNIAVQSIYQIIVLLIILLAADKIWDIEDHSEEHYTMIFNTFVYCQVFNLLNSRVVARGQSFFDGIFSNWMFIVIFIGIAAVQAILIEFGGSIFQTCHLDWVLWLSCLAFSVFTLVIGAIVRLVPIKEVTYEEVEATREVMYEQLKETLRGLTEDEQWAKENEEAENEKREIEKPKGQPTNPTTTDADGESK